MGKIHEEISPSLATFIARHHVWFVATAPLRKDFNVNVSPKSGIGSCAVLDSHTVAYVDLTGSGSETIGHTLDNGRIRKVHFTRGSATCLTCQISFFYDLFAGLSRYCMGHRESGYYIVWI